VKTGDTCKHPHILLNLHVTPVQNGTCQYMRPDVS
jgi:hypothetical protein